MITKKNIYILILPLLTSYFSSCSKTTYNKASTILEDNFISLSNIMVVKNMDSIRELRNEEGEHLFYFPNFEEAHKTKIVLEHYQTKFICKSDEGCYKNSIGEKNTNSLIMQYQLSYDSSGIGNKEINSYTKPSEDCLPFDSEKLVAKRSLDGNWFLIENQGILYLDMERTKKNV